MSGSHELLLLRICGYVARARVVSEAVLPIRTFRLIDARAEKVGIKRRRYGMVIAGAARSRPVMTQRSISAWSAPAAMHSLAICRHRAASHPASA